MAGIIEHQQGIVHSQLVEKLQQTKQEHLNVYQQYAGVEFQRQNIQQQRRVREMQTLPETRIDEKGKNDRDKKRPRKDRGRTQHGQQEPETGSDEQLTGTRIDIVA